MVVQREPELQPSLRRRLAWLGVLLAGVVAYSVVLRVVVATQNLTFFPSLLLIGAVTVPLAVVVFAESGGRAIPVRTRVVVATAIAGGVVGTVTAGVLEYRALERLGPASVLLVGVIEEAAKLVVPLLVLLATRPRDARGGIVVGIASGAGFAVLETMGYGFQALLREGDVAAVDQTLMLRALLSPAGHVAWTGIVVAALWRVAAAEQHRRGRALAVLGGAYALAVVLHTLWDLTASTAVHVVVVLVSVVLLLVLVHRAHVRPRSWAPRLSAPVPPR